MGREDKRGAERRREEERRVEKRSEVNRREEKRREEKRREEKRREEKGREEGENASKAFSHLQQMKMPRSPMLGPVLLGLLLIARCPNLLPSTSIQPLPISLKSWR